MSSQPEGGLEEGSEEGERRAKCETRSKERALGLGWEKAKHVGWSVCGSAGATDQWVTLQKKSTVGIR